MKSVLAGIAVALVLGLGIVALLSDDAASPQTVTTADMNVTVVDGAQIVVITAKGGYTPATSTVKAGIPTVLRFVTKGTFDCSSIISIPSLGISKNLPMTGTTDIAIGSLQPGTLQGSCGMGMYWFALDVQAT